MNRMSRIEADYLDPDRHLWPDDQCCEVCKQDPADCECPVCPVCKVQGDPNCYFEDGIFGGCERYRWFEYEYENILERVILHRLLDGDDLAIFDR